MTSYIDEANQKVVASVRYVHHRTGYTGTVHLVVLSLVVLLNA